MPRPFEYQSEVESYLHLQTKVFLSEAEKNEKRDMLFHKGLLQALGRRLLEPSRDMTVAQQQDAAIDILMEALKNGDKSVASEVLQGVVQDSQVEDGKMERGSREQLAGLKAEVLYQWSATNPDMSASLVSWLPGPVSQKIWQNVVRMQQNNQAESEAEVQARSMSH